MYVCSASVLLSNTNDGMMIDDKWSFGLVTGLYAYSALVSDSLICCSFLPFRRPKTAHSRYTGVLGMCYSCPSKWLFLRPIVSFRCSVSLRRTPEFVSVLFPGHRPSGRGRRFSPAVWSRRPVRAAAIAASSARRHRCLVGPRSLPRRRSTVTPVLLIYGYYLRYYSAAVPLSSCYEVVRLLTNHPVTTSNDPINILMSSGNSQLF